MIEAGNFLEVVAESNVVELPLLKQQRQAQEAIKHIARKVASIA